MRIALSPPASPPFKTGALVEVQSKETLYLGEIVGTQESFLIVAIEHAVNREALAAIQNGWQAQDQT